MQERKGLVAILDALGASAYSAADIKEFLKSAYLLLEMLQKKVESVFLEARRLSTFTFNDTLVIAYETKPGIDIDYIEAFCSVLRHFE